MNGHRGRALLAALAAVLAAAGLIALIVGVRAQQHAPQPPASAAGGYALTPSANRSPGPVGTPESRPATPVTPSSTAPSGPVLAASAPTHLSIPAIGVNTDLLQLGLNPDNTVQVPPLTRKSEAGWYKYSPSPGELGPAVLLGHIDSAEYGPGVFFKIGALHVGDTVSVTRTDNTIAVFHVDAVAEYPKGQFPTLTVYGNTDNAVLRLITCGGKFDFTAKSYDDNIVVFASLTSSQPG